MWYWPVITLLLLFPQISVGEEINAGFVNGLWYSEDTIFAEETVRVYVAIRNNTDADLTGMVTFFNNDKKIGTQTITALNGRIIESWIDWKPAYGENTIKAELSQLKLSVVGKDIENINIAIAAATDNIFVDYDTDGDNIGNNTDSDDDNDSISDAEETKNGTNPLIKNNADNSEGNSNQAIAASINSEPEEATSEAQTEYGGLERFLTPSRADTLLTQVTTWSDETKQKIDAYRIRRKAVTNESTLSVMVDNDGFGEISRTNTQDQSAKSKAAETVLIPDLINIVAKLSGIILTAVLATLSWTLGYSILIQLLILIGILSGIYFTARKLGGRPNKKKKR